MARTEPTRPAWRSPLVLMTVAVLVVAGAVILLNQRPAPTDTGGSLIAPPIAYAADITDGQSLGRANAPVVMEVYSDFQCPICARFVREQYPNLKTMFIDTGVLRIVSHDIALLGVGNPDESLELAVGARCAADQGRYWYFHDLIFWNQGRENRGDHSAGFIASVANRAGVDRSVWDKCVAGDTVRSAIEADTATTVRAGINSTPTLVLNGAAPVAGLPSAAALIAQIQQLVAAASPAASPSP